MSPPDDAWCADVTLAILAGGAGSRMGMPKGNVTLGERRILDYQLDSLQWPGVTLLVTAPGREHPPGWQRFSREVTDPHASGGPLRGVLTALEHLQTPLLLVLPVDMPGIRQTQCRTLVERFRRHPDSVGAMMRRQVDGQSQVEPFPFVLRVSARPLVNFRLAEQRRSVHSLLEDSRFLAIDVAEEWPEEVWTNLNSPRDVEEFRA